MVLGFNKYSMNQQCEYLYLYIPVCPTNLFRWVSARSAASRWWPCASRDITALDMVIAKVGRVEVVVVKLKNCHSKTSLVTKNYWLVGCKVYCFQQKLLTFFFLRTEFVYTKNIEKNLPTRTIYRQLPEVRGGGPRNVLQQTRGRAQAGTGSPFICSPLETLTTWCYVYDDWWSPIYL